jgi:mRNA-decapping enzyme subunit 2
LDDLCVRFIINLPEEDLSTVARICFQVEEAQWFYEDFIRPLDPTLPSMSLRSFCLRIFQHCPLLAPFSVENHTKAFEEFLQYKTRVPVRGAILLNEAMDSTILVKGWKKGANWSFPRGKINKDEDDLDCAIREVYEETGFDIRAAGLVPDNEAVKYIEITMREQQMRLYVFRDVPMDTHFQPRTRKEISKIQWYRLSELPAFRKKGSQAPNDAAAAANANKFYMVAPFLVPLKKWVVQQKKRDATRTASDVYLNTHTLRDELVTEDDIYQPHPQSRPLIHQPPAPEEGRTPAIDTLEGATRELQRLLNLQPATQGLQVSAPATLEEDKGGALLAILKAKSNNTQGSTGSAPNPHTPLDHAIADPALPQAPHNQYHNQPRAPVPSYQQPPPFHMNPNVVGGGWDHLMQSSQMLEQPHAASHQYPQHQPTLVHPQPLPPQVQKSLLSQGLNTPPPASNAANTSRARTIVTETSSFSMTQHQTTQGAKRNQSQLSSHSMALLNAFKGDSSRPPHASKRDDVENPQYQAQPQTHGQAYVSPKGPQAYQTGPSPQWEAPPPPQHHGQHIGGGVAFNKTNSNTEKHRSALLDMFKNPQPTIPPNNENARRDVSHGQYGTVHGQNQVSSQALTQALSSLSIQSKPPQANTSSHGQPPFGQRPIENPSAHPNPGSVASRIAAPQSLSGRPIQILQRKENMDQSASPWGSTGPPSAAASYASPRQMPGSLASPPATSALPAPSIGGHKAEVSTEQKQKLLSLFGKQPSPISTLVNEDRGKGIGQSPVESGQRSRVASLASGAGEPHQGNVPMSRGGSQTPISPANRSFLLGYLESAMANAHR